MAARAIPNEDAYPWLPWRTVRSYVDKAWDAENTPHHSIIGLTGSGKSFLMAYGLLDISKGDRVLIIDTKGDDPIISKIGKPVKEFPKRAWYAGVTRRKNEPMANWYRLTVSDKITAARDQVGMALNSAYDDGEWIIVIDELFDVVSTDRNVGLNLRGMYQKIMRKGRSRGVPCIAATQEPVWMPSEFYSQASFAWVGRIRDEERQKRLLQIGGLTKADLPIISELQRRDWLLAADNGEFFARSKVVK